MERSFCFGNLDLSCRKPTLLCALLQPAPEKGLAAAVLASDGLESSCASRNCGQFLVKSTPEAIQTNRQHVQAAFRYRATAERCNDLLSPLATDGHGTWISNCCSSSSRLRVTVSDASSI